jgi:hypothetical protein
MDQAQEGNVSGIKTIGQVATYKPLSRLNMEELAMRQRSIKASGGIEFARTTERDQKDAARQQIIDMFSLSVWPGRLRMLTMPGLDWRFERKLLGRREGNWMHKRAPERTYFTCVENDRALYYASVAKIPGVDTRGAKLTILQPPKFAEYGLKTKFIGGYFFANMDDLMRSTGWTFDAAWLDYTGPMSVERLKLIESFYQRSVYNILIVTVLRARWTQAAVEAIERAGGHSEWLHAHLPGEVLHNLEYNDTVPMTQFAVRKIAGGEYGNQIAASRQNDQ